MEVDLKERASDNLSFIRSAMERAGRVSSVSGLALMAMGAIALVTAAAAASRPTLQTGLELWLGAALLAGACGALGSIRKARRSGVSLFADPGRRFLLCLLPTLAVGALLTALLWETPQLPALPAFWLLLYGAGVLAAGTYAAAPVMYMGGAFLILGLAAWALPVAWQHGALAAGFGGLHLYFGYQIYRHHGG